MPYKSKGKKDCTQSDGSKGKYQTVKKNGSKRCYKSKKQYDAAMAWAHEADEAGYGEEINEDIMRILVKGFILDEAQNINTAKHYLDSNTTTSARRPINYMMWIEDGMPSSSNPSKPYSDDVENFVKFRNSFSAFEVVEKSTLIVLDPVGDVAKDQPTLDKGTKIQLLEPMSDKNAAKNANVVKRGSTHFVKIRTQNGLEGYFPSLKLGHNLAGSAKGKINNAEIGAAIESVVFAAINNLGRDEALKMAVGDSRAAKYPSASDSEKTRFESLMKTGYDSVISYLSKDTSPSFSDPVDPRPQAGEGNTAAVDVPVKANGQTAEIHVKYNDEKRLFGLRKADGSKASPEFTKARNEVLKQHVPTLESYRSWVSNYRKGDFDPTMVADLSNKEIEGRLKKFGTITIGPNWSPMTRSTPEGASDVFIDPRSLVTNMHKKSGLFQAGITSLMQLDPLLLTKPPFDAVSKLLKVDVENAIRPNSDRSPGGVFYFNFTGKGSAATLNVTAFAVDLEVEVVVHNSVGDQNSLSIGYDIQVNVGEETLTPFRVQISSLARGKPLQVEKTDDLKKLLKVAKDSAKGMEAAFGDLISKPSRKMTMPTPGIDRRATPEELKRLAAGIQRYAKIIIKEMLEDSISSSNTRLIIEELTGTDKSDIKRMIAKEIEGASNRRETQKVFQAEFEKELKKSIKNSRSIKDSIKKEVEAVFKDKATKNQVGEITKAVMKKLYRELSMNTPHVIDNIKL